MKPISVFPGKPNSVRVAELPKPSLDQSQTVAACWSKSCGLAWTTPTKKSTLLGLAV